MVRNAGSVAHQLDFGELTTTVRTNLPRQAELRLAVLPQGLRGPDKYKVLESRRRQAQIKARRLLDLI